MARKNECKPHVLQCYRKRPAFWPPMSQPSNWRVTDVKTHLLRKVSFCFCLTSQSCWRFSQSDRVTQKWTLQNCSCWTSCRPDDFRQPTNGSQETESNYHYNKKKFTEKSTFLFLQLYLLTTVERHCCEIQHTFQRSTVCSARCIRLDFSAYHRDMAQEGLHQLRWQTVTHISSTHTILNQTGISR